VRDADRPTSLSLRLFSAAPIARPRRRASSTEDITFL
jgi:hypothetical protein